MAERRSTRRIGRRGLIAGIAAAGAGVLLAACGAPAPSPQAGAQTPATKAEPAAKPAAPPPQAAPQAAATKAEAPAAAVPATKAKATELNLVWSGWILNANPVVNELAGEYAQQTGVKVVV